MKPTAFTISYFSDNRGYLSVPFDLEVQEKFNFQLKQLNQVFSHKANTLRGLHFRELFQIVLLING